MQLGPLDVRILGGSDGKGGGDGPIVVLLHGFGAPGDDLVPLWRAFDVPSDVRWVFPAAPLTLPSMGFGMESRAWWMIDMFALEEAMARGEMRDLSKTMPEGLPGARTAVLEMLDALTAELGPAPLMLGGFSQGAMLSLDVALHMDRPLSALFLMSGTLLDESVWVPRMAARRNLPVLLSHGRQDPLLPFSLSERLREHLTAAGMAVEHVPFNGGHDIPPPVIQGLERVLLQALSGASE
ncbi:MAG: alpha/beta hydrolase [Sandaracinaceae bacterium]